MRNTGLVEDPRLGYRSPAGPNKSGEDTSALVPKY